MATGDIKDPFVSYNFEVEIDGITRAAFQECSGFDSTVDIVEHREGNDPSTPRKVPGMVKHSNITLKWGVTDDVELYEWHRQIASGEIVRKNGSIVLKDRAGEEVKRWNFFRAWPTKWTGPSLNAESSEVSIETLELAHEGLALA
jgi:phage tail-like protein